jgi:TonB family protein
MRPQFTKQAMDATIQGTVLIGAVAPVSGDVADVEVVRSLKDKYGLDRSAVATAKQWKFGREKKWKAIRE